MLKLKILNNLLSQMELMDELNRTQRTILFYCIVNVDNNSLFNLNQSKASSELGYSQPLISISINHLLSIGYIDTTQNKKTYSLQPLIKMLGLDIDDSCDNNKQDIFELKEENHYLKGKLNNITAIFADLALQMTN